MSADMRMTYCSPADWFAGRSAGKRAGQTGAIGTDGGSYFWSHLIIERIFLELGLAPNSPEVSVEEREKRDAYEK